MVRINDCCWSWSRSSFWRIKWNSGFINGYQLFLAVIDVQIVLFSIKENSFQYAQDVQVNLLVWYVQYLDVNKYSYMCLGCTFMPTNNWRRYSGKNKIRKYKYKTCNNRFFVWNSINDDIYCFNKILPNDRIWIRQKIKIKEWGVLKVSRYYHYTKGYHYICSNRKKYNGTLQEANVYCLFLIFRIIFSCFLFFRSNNNLY